MNIVLIGYRGTGKGAIAKRLAKRTGFKLLETDEMIEKGAGMSIPEIFERLGEPKFRDLESKAVTEACSQDKAVISTGGGAPMRKENAETMKKNGIVVLLEARPEVIYNRIKGDSNRPALTDLNDEFKEFVVMLEKRNPTYHSLADFVLDTSNKKVEENVEGIINFLEKKGVLENAKD